MDDNYVVKIRYTFVSRKNLAKVRDSSQGGIYGKSVVIAGKH